MEQHGGDPHSPTLYDFKDGCIRFPYHDGFSLGSMTDETHLATSTY